MTKFGWESGFGLAFLFNSAFSTKAFEAGGTDSAPKTFGRRIQGALELVNAGTYTTRKRRTDSKLGLAPRFKFLRVILLEETPPSLSRRLRVVGIYVNGNVIVKANSNHRA